MRSVCQRLKAQIQDWDCDKFGPGSPLQRSLERAKANPPISEWAKEAKDVIPPKYLNGRDASFYQKYLRAKQANQSS